MFKVLLCIQQNHDFKLVLVAAVVCLLATGTTVWLYGRTLQQQRGPWRLSCMALTGVAAGSGVWATHFIAMLAYAPVLQTGYDLAGTGLSLALAIASTAAGFALAASSPRRLSVVLGGAVVGGGIGLMHYVGMLAFRPRGIMLWDQGYIIASLMIGVSLAIASLCVAGPKPGLRRGAAAALVLTVAICGLHFTAMAAATILPDASIAIPPELAARPVLAVMVFAVAVLILLAAGMIAGVEAAHRRAAVNKLRIATDAMPAALAVYDAEDRLVVWNAAYQRLRPNYDALLKPGLSFDDIIRADGHDEVWLAERKRDRRAGRPLEYEFPGGVWVRIENKPTADGGLITVGVDVTELKRHAEALASALGQAEAASRAKSEFLANMSHEIRTPLNGVAGVAYALARTRLTAQQKDLVGVIRNSAEAVDSLLADILDLSRIEAGQAEPVVARFHLGKAIRAVAGLHIPKATAQGIDLRLELASEIETEVLGDERRLKQILSGLLSNAVKFTDQGEVVVSAMALDGERFRLQVQDTGVGFDAAFKDRLCEQFAQADGSATRRHAGAGLGLTLARRCADLLGARLDCESEPGKGSIFTLDVPLSRSLSPQAQIRQPAAVEAGPVTDRPLLALIVDDNATNRRVLELILQQFGACWVSVDNGQKAVEAFEAQRFDVILMDLQMPVMDGFTATREIRRREQSAGGGRTPIIIVSANCMPDQVAAGREAGAECHLAKPVNASVLMGTVAEVLDRAERPQKPDERRRRPGRARARA